MAKEIGHPWPAALLQDALDIKGRVNLRLEEFIIPTIQITDLNLGGALPIQRSAAAGFAQGAVAAEFATWRFEVPPSVVAQITRLMVIGNSTVIAQFTNVAAPLAGVALTEYTDGRLVAAGELTAGFVSFGTKAAGLTAPTWRGRASTKMEQILAPAWVIGSGNATDFGFVEFQHQLVNTAVTVAIDWIEYQIV